MTHTEFAELVHRWERIVDEVERGYDLTLDDYLNDMDLRDLVARTAPTAPASTRSAMAPRLAAADSRFRSATEPCGPLWGPDVAEEQAHDPRRQWWYFRRPARPGPTLAADLTQAGLL
jgi:hypothetical protein